MSSTWEENPQSALRMQNAPPAVDPRNPFDNQMENVSYRTDYRRIQPAVGVPGYQLPLYPDKMERRGIRKCFNDAGLWVILVLVAEQIIFVILLAIVLLGMGVSMVDYFTDDTVYDYLNESSIYITINALLFTCVNVLAAYGGCRYTHTPVKSLFQTENLNVSTVLRYICTAIGIQMAASIVYTWISSLASDAGTDLVEADFDYFDTGKSTLMVVLYTCVLAPITEEFFYRGFLQKNLSRVSARFGIVVTALLFGLAHGNVSQFLLGFLLGLYLGKITERHNSIVPSIWVHIGVNSSSMILSLIEAYWTTEAGEIVLGFAVMAYYTIAILGICFWFWKERKQPMPYPTQEQSTRNHVFWSSPLLLIAFALDIVILLMNQFA